MSLIEFALFVFTISYILVFASLINLLNKLEKTSCFGKCFERENEDVVIIDGVHYLKMNKIEVVDHIWGVKDICEAHKNIDADCCQVCLMNEINRLREALSNFSDKKHIGSPCLLCGIGHDDVSVGDCNNDLVHVNKF